MAVTNRAQDVPRMPARRIAALALPALVVLAAEPLYVLVDTAVVGHLGRTQLAAIALGGASPEMVGLGQVGIGLFSGAVMVTFVVEGDATGGRQAAGSALCHERPAVRGPRRSGLQV